MRHIIIQVESIMKYPPTLSLMKMLKKLGHEVMLLTSEINEAVIQRCRNDKVYLVNVGFSYSPQNQPVTKLVKIPLIERQINKILSKYYKNDRTLIWIMTSISLKYIGNALEGKRYIMYMYELSQEIRFYPQFPYPKVNLSRLFKNAAAVIECEYNRAFIAQAWFNLAQLPYVVPNKPFMEPLPKKMKIKNKACAEIIEKIKDKKIILYQGIIDAERPLEPFIKVVEELGEEYALVVMSSDIEKLRAVESRNLYLLPFVNPPHHLEITSWSYIGILSYIPVRGATTSPLNAVFCAPNKIYEYAMFGIPMLGNDMPGLKYSITEREMGVCFRSFSGKDIKNSIFEIETNYQRFSENAEIFYKINNLEMIERIINDVNER